MSRELLVLGVCVLLGVVVLNLYVLSTIVKDGRDDRRLREERETHERSDVELLDGDDWGIRWYP
jgi:hypothetical protein